MKTIQNIMQIGRSMTEMLGVLAIIGVLSVTSVWAYKTAINKSKANDVIYDANMIAGVITTSDQMQNAIAEEWLTFTEYANSKSGYTFESAKETNEIFSVSALNVPKGVCERIIDMSNVDFLVSVNNTGYDTVANNLCVQDNKINFYYDVTNTVKCGGKICYGGKICVEEECTCPNGMHFTDGKCVCDSTAPNQCGNECYTACTAGEFDCETKQCICSEPTHLPTPVNGACVCPANMQEGADGKCHTKSCTGGTAGKQNWTCSIDDQRCGYNCTEDGLTCKNGICDMGMCPTGTNHVYFEAKNLYSCETSKGLKCLKTTTQSLSSGGVFCFLPTDYNVPCCNGKLDGSCNYGICDASICPEGTYFGKVASSFTYGPEYGCWKDDNSLQCTKNYTSVTCADADGVICGAGCTYDGHCKSKNLCPDARCQEHESWDEINQKCISVCPIGTTHSVVGIMPRCTQSDGAFCQLNANGSVYCYLANGAFCGNSCQLDGKKCTNGTCESTDCPSDLIYKSITGGGYGCYSEETHIGCFPSNQTRTKWTCYQDGTICSGTCTDPYGSACCKEFSCPAGTQLKTKFYSDAKYYNACYNPIHDTTCLDSNSKTCIRNGKSCGSGCNLDGTGCTSASKCVESECGSSKTLVFVNEAWSCHDTALSCTGGECTLNGSKCGSGCDTNGANCSYGVCLESDCPPDTYLSKVSTLGYGCKNDKGVACYKESGKYSCVKGGSLCASGCETLNAVHRFYCDMDTCDD